MVQGPSSGASSIQKQSRPAHETGILDVSPLRTSTHEPKSRSPSTNFVKGQALFVKTYWAIPSCPAPASPVAGAIDAPSDRNSRRPTRDVRDGTLQVKWMVYVITYGVELELRIGGDACPKRLLSREFVSIGIDDVNGCFGCRQHSCVPDWVLLWYSCISTPAQNQCSLSRSCRALKLPRLGPRIIIATFAFPPVYHDQCRPWSGKRFGRSAAVVSPVK